MRRVFIGILAVTLIAVIATVSGQKEAKALKVDITKGEVTNARLDVETDTEIIEREQAFTPRDSGTSLLTGGCTTYIRREPSVAVSERAVSTDEGYSGYADGDTEGVGEDAPDAPDYAEYGSELYDTELSGSVDVSQQSGDEYTDEYSEGKNGESVSEGRPDNADSGVTEEDTTFIEEDTTFEEEDTTFVEEDATSETGLTYLGAWTATAYCSCPICCGDYASGYTASGTLATEGRTIACNELPIGTQVMIDGNIYIVEDTGWSPYSQWLDIYFDSHDTALAFGMRTVDVYLVG